MSRPDAKYVTSTIHVERYRSYTHPHAHLSPATMPATSWWRPRGGPERPATLAAPVPATSQIVDRGVIGSMDIEASGHDGVSQQCGRLLAHLDLIRRSVDGDGAIGTTCFQQAAAMPGPVLGALLTMSWRDLTAIRRQSGGTQRADWLEARLGDILSDLGTPMPHLLDRAGQGDFAMGFYQERATARAMGSLARHRPVPVIQDAVLRELTVDPVSAVPDDL